MILLAIIVGLFFNWKLIRLTGIIDNEMNYLWDLHVYIMIIIMIISLKYIPKYLNLLDVLFLMCLLSFSISLITNGVLSNLEFGGIEGNILYVTATTSLYSMELNQIGAKYR